MNLPCCINFLPWTSLALSFFLLLSRVQLSGAGSPRLMLTPTDQGQEKGSQYLLPPTLPPKPFTSKQGSPQIAQWAFQCRNPGSSWCGKVKPISGKDIRYGPPRDGRRLRNRQEKLRWPPLACKYCTEEWWGWAFLYKKALRDKMDIPEYCNCYIISNHWLKMRLDKK